MKMEIIIAIATPITAFLGAILGHWISVRSSRQERKHQLAMAALEKRLHVHQEAITICFSIWHNIFNDQELYKIVEHGQDWYYNNCLYLGDIARDDFWNCLIAAPNHAGLVHSYREDMQDESTKQMVNESWNVIHKPAYSIPAAVGLPSFGSNEFPFNEDSQS